MKRAPGAVAGSHTGLARSADLQIIVGVARIHHCVGGTGEAALGGVALVVGGALAVG